MRSAQLAYQTANDTLNQITDVKNIQDEIDNAVYTIKFAKSMMGSQVTADLSIATGYIYWNNVRANAQATLDQANQQRTALLSGATPASSSAVALDLAKKQLALEQAEFGITQAQLDLQNAQLAMDDARNVIAPAQEDVQNAQDDLKTAQKKSS